MGEPKNAMQSIANEDRMTIADRFVELNEEDEIAVERLRRAVDVFREIDTALPASYLAAFLLVAARPGGSTTEYAAEMGQAQAVTSRILLEIGKKSRTGNPGHELVDSDAHPDDLRRRRVFLTPKGRRLLRKVVDAVRRNDERILRRRA
jgi:DNA-binding MarR family transcriptional regulator